MNTCDFCGIDEAITELIVAELLEGSDELEGVMDIYPIRLPICKICKEDIKRPFNKG